MRRMSSERALGSLQTVCRLSCCGIPRTVFSFRWHLNNRTVIIYEGYYISHKGVETGTCRSAPIKGPSGSFPAKTLTVRDTSKQLIALESGFWVVFCEWRSGLYRKLNEMGNLLLYRCKGARYLFMGLDYCFTDLIAVIKRKVNVHEE